MKKLLISITVFLFMCGVCFGGTLTPADTDILRVLDKVYVIQTYIPSVQSNTTGDLQTIDLPFQKGMIDYISIACPTSSYSDDYDLSIYTKTSGSYEGSVYEIYDYDGINRSMSDNDLNLIYMNRDNSTTDDIGVKIKNDDTNTNTGVMLLEMIIHAVQ